MAVSRVASLRLSPAELERRRKNAERRQRYRGPRQKPYKPRDTAYLKRPKVRSAAATARRAERRVDCEVSVWLPSNELKEQIRTAAARAGLSMSAWIAELIEDTLRFDATMQADRTAET